MLGAALLTAQFVAARAARDAIYLAHLDVATLPLIVIATAACSLALVALSSFAFRRWSPLTLVPLAFGLSAGLFAAEWGLLATTPTVVARLLYLHVSGLGPMLASAFWLIAAETFDPRTAKKFFSRIGGAGTFGGLVGALLADRLAALADDSAILLVLAAFNVACAWQMRRLARSTSDDRVRAGESPELVAASARSGVRALATTPYLRDLGALVLLGTAAAALLDYAFKVAAVDALGRGETLLRFFAAYYGGVSVLTFVVQIAASRQVLERFGLAAAASTPAAAIVAGGLSALAWPGLPAMAVARGGESALRGSLFRAGYEILYTPVAPVDRRAAKSMIDVGCDRFGDAIGGGLVRVAQMTALSTPRLVVALAIACAALALIAAARLRRGYVATLERSLVNRAVELDLSDVQDLTTRTAMFKSLGPSFGAPPASSQSTASLSRSDIDEGARHSTQHTPARNAELQKIARDPELQRIAELRSRDRVRVVRVLQDMEGVTAVLVPHIVPLLAWDEVAEDAIRALRAVAEERVGELTDVLLDRNQPFPVRRRLARVFSVCVSQRAADGLLAALDDLRFEVRFQCARSLAAIVERNPRVRLDSARLLEIVDREVSVGRPVWESRHLLDRPDDSAPRSVLDDFLMARASQSLSHVFTLLTLAFPGEPLRYAFMGLQTNDRRLRGTALEYLEQVLPAPVRERLWAFLDAPPVTARPGRARADVVADLVRANPSIMMNLEELHRLQRKMEKK
jgi:AAA family ATP:ADP antiporter